MSGPEDLRGGHLHFDCVSGIAGDMSMGALMDLGVPAQVIRDAVSAVGLDGARLKVEKIIKSGIAATNAWVLCESAGSELPAAAHEPSGEPASDAHHEHYHYSAIRRRIQDAPLASDVATLSLAIFDRLADAEAKLHGTTPDNVAFHEVGAVDSIVDVIGTAAAICWLSPVSVSASPVAMGQGSIHCAHGILPVPSPAAMEIMRVAGAPITDGGVAKELCTPTGAAILAALVSRWGGMPAMTPVAIGYGAGDCDLPDRPNVLRATLGRLAGTSTRPRNEVLEIEANIDDMSAELCEHVVERLFSAGALDVWWTAITMKKGRPAWTLHVLSEPETVDAMTMHILRETTSIGLRIARKERKILERSISHVDTEFGPIPMKIARHEGVVVNAAPEFEVCLERARQSNVPLKNVFAAANAAWQHSDKI